MLDATIFGLSSGCTTLLPTALQESTDTKIRLSNKVDDGIYSTCFSNPKAYKEWFAEMGTVF